MRKTVKVWMAAALSGVILAGGPGMAGQVPWGIEAQAHSGRTDASGGHRDNKNASGLGSYHYHCGGHPAHLHPGGVCPYASTTAAQTQATQAAQTQAAQTQTAQTQAAVKQAREQAAASGHHGEGNHGGEFHGGWNHDGEHWRYICEDGTSLSGCWKQIDGVWYCFDGEGCMYTGWYKENGCRYYLGTDGKMVTGHCVIDGEDYEFDRDGRLVAPDAE